MKRSFIVHRLSFIVVFALCLCASVAHGATKLFLRSADTKVMFGSPDYIGRLLSTSQGTAMVAAVMNSIAGPLTGHYWPISTAGYIFTPSAGTSRRVWISAPLSAGVTVAGTITPNVWGLESAAQCNCGFRYQVLRWAVSQGGIVSSLGVSTDSGATEWGTAAAVRTAPTLTPTSTTFNAGDRIVIVLYNDDGNGVTEANGRTWTLDFEGATGVDGDTYFSFTETISLSADSNNARPVPSWSGIRPEMQGSWYGARTVPLTSWNLLPHLLNVWQEYWSRFQSLAFGKAPLAPTRLERVPFQPVSRNLAPAERQGLEPGRDWREALG